MERQLTRTWGRSIECSHCHAPILLTELVPTVKCAHCGYVETVDPQLLLELEQYQGEVQQKLDEAARLHDAVERPKAEFRLAVYMQLIGYGVLLVAGAAIMLTGRWSLGQVMGPILGLLTVGFVVAQLFRRSSRYRLKHGVKVRCPLCGGENLLDPGAPLGACKFCGAALAPGQAAQGKVLAAAEQVLQGAQLERLRAEHAKIYEKYGIRQYLAGREFETAIAEFARTVGWVDVTGPRQTLSWLDRWWDAPIDRLPVVSGYGGGSVAGVLDGYPVLLDAVPLADPCAILLVACRPPGTVAGEPPALPPSSAAVPWDQLRAAGFDLRVTSAGLWIELPGTYSAALTLPGLPHIRGILPLLPQAARAIGAGPAQPLG
jgi:hypothetical protein